MAKLYLRHRPSQIFKKTLSHIPQALASFFGKIPNPRSYSLNVGTVENNDKIRLQRYQWEVFQSPARFRVLVAGRRFGKTELALAEILRAARRANQRIWYLGPSIDQSRRIFWERIKDQTETFWAKRPNETQMRIDLLNGSQIIVGGIFKPSARRGNGIDFVVLDEFPYIKPHVWRHILRPALADRQGGALFLGTPLGRDHLYDFFQRGQGLLPDWLSYQFSTKDGGIVCLAELASAADDLDPDSFRQEFQGQFPNFAKHSVYSSFDRHANIKPVDFAPMHELMWALDFNVDPMCMLLIQRLSNDEVHVLDEIIIKPNATTELACQAFLSRVQPLSNLVPAYQRPLRVRVYGDASGNQRHTSGTSTDWAIIKEFFRLWVGTFSPSYHTTPANPLVRDRVNCVNARLRNASGETRLFIDPKCKELIRDMEEVSWKSDSTGTAFAEMDKSDRTRTHSSDALGYFIAQAFPLLPLAGHQPNHMFSW